MTNKYGSLKLNILSPELIETKRPYSFNLNPSDEHQYFSKESNRIRDVGRYFSTYLVTLFTAHCEVYMEISRTGRLHFHGIITFNTTNDIRQFYIEAIHNLLKQCTIEIDTIKDMDIWRTYITKCQSLIKWHYVSSPLRRVEDSFLVQYKDYFTCQLKVPQKGDNKSDTKIFNLEYEPQDE